MPITTVTPLLQPNEPASLVIWIPESLAPVNDESLNAILEAEVNEFVIAENDIRVEIRRKSSQPVGGIMSTLRTASAVAPGALPDITLMRREDLLDAVDDGLIQPLEGRIASAVIADLFPSALRLGRAEDQLYGLPYLLDLYLYAYHETAEPPPARWTLEDVLERGQTFALPSVRANGMADILWLQYTAAGGALPVDGVLELTPDAVSEILNFYEQLFQQRLIAPGTLEFGAPADYLDGLANGQIDTGVINTGILRSLQGVEPPLKFAAVPTSSGQAATLVNGWMWVIVTPDIGQQALAGRFLNWMMDAGRHSAYAQAIGMPPSQRSSLRRWTIDGLDNALLGELLSDALPLQPEVDASGAARALQSAWVDVLAGRATAVEAAAAALEP